MSHKIAPSLLAADFGNLQRDIEMVNQSSADWFHLDIMDGVFVPNISFGFPVMKPLQAKAQKTLDVLNENQKSAKQRVTDFIELEKNEMFLMISKEYENYLEQLKGQRWCKIFGLVALREQGHAHLAARNIRLHSAAQPLDRLQRRRNGLPARETQGDLDENPPTRAPRSHTVERRIAVKVFRQAAVNPQLQVLLQ